MDVLVYYRARDPDRGGSMQLRTCGPRRAIAALRKYSLGQMGVSEIGVFLWGSDGIPLDSIVLGV